MIKARRLHRLTAEFELVTPAFCGGARPSNGTTTVRAEIRLPSLLGSLRFWWRALAWARTVETVDRSRLATVAAWEQDLFGSARTGQGRFVARLSADKTAACGDREQRVGGYRHELFGHRDDSELEWRRPPQGITYLAGQGLTRYRQGANRDECPSLRDSGGFSLALASRQPFLDGPGSNDGPSIVDALRILGLIGGVGARTRRGFGSLRLKSITVDDGSSTPLSLESPPSDVHTYRAALETLLGRLPHDTQEIADIPYTALTRHSRAWLVTPPEGTDVAQLHNEMGFRFLYYRGTGFGKGRNRSVGGVGKDILVDHRFEGDHMWFGQAREAKNGNEIVGAPERSIFGLPHNYFKPRDKNNPNSVPYNVDVAPEGYDRRASPLFLHLHRFDDGLPIAVWLYLPSSFLPTTADEMASLRVSNGQRNPNSGGKVSTAVPFAPNWQPIEGLFDDGHMPGADEIRRASVL